MRWPLVLACLCSACGARVAQPAGQDAPPVVDSAAVDWDTDFDPDRPAPPIDAELPRDTAGPWIPVEAGAECGTRPDACDHSVADVDAARLGLMKLAQECLTPVWTCGFVYLEVDELGCARHFRLERPKDPVAKCIAERLASVQFACARGTEVVSQVDSCTVK